MDEGPRIAYLVLEKGVPVYASDGEEVGTVHHVVSAPEKDIFHGVVMSGAHGRQFVAADQIAELHERGVDLLIDAEEARGLAAPHGAAPVWRDSEPGVKPSSWSHVIGMFGPNGPKRHGWKRGD